MPSYKLAAPANNDLREIALYTKKSWGPEQARTYIQELRKAMEALAQTPKIGRPREELAPGLRSFKAGSHIVFYKESKAGINIARILHSKRDIEHELDKT